MSGFDEAAHVEALDRLTARVVKDRRRGRATPASVVLQVDVGTVRLLARRAADRRRVAAALEAVAAQRRPGSEQRESAVRLARTYRASADSAQRACDELLAALPEPWATTAARSLAADSVARRSKEGR